jgi:glycosyltransferase involved in cell wall biosynthesis
LNSICQDDDGCRLEEQFRCVHYLRHVRLEEGGVARAVLDICSLLARRGHHVTLLTADARDVPAAWQAGDKNLPRAVIIPAPRFAGPAPVEAESALRNAHVLHLHAPWEISNLPLARWARRWHIPYIVSIHGMLDRWSLRQKRLKKWLFLALVGRRFLAGAARVHCTALAELEQAAHLLRPGSGVVIPYAIDLAAFVELPGTAIALSAYPGLTRDTPRLLFLSRLHPKKRPDLLIEAAAMLARAGQPCQVILAGPGETRYIARLQRLANERGLNRSVIFTGMIDGLTKASLFQAGDVFVLPTSQENFGIVLVEALAAGTPVVTTRGVDIWQHLKAAGAVIVDQDSAQMATAIGSLIADLPKASKRGHEGREWVFRELDADRVIGAYGRMYRDVADVVAPNTSPVQKA